MPDETPEQKAAREAEEARDKAMVDRIANGVSAGLKPVIERLAERETQTPVVTRSEPATITRPTDKQLADALIAGNTDEYARLRALERQADRQEQQRELGNIRVQGGAAIGAVAKAEAERSLPYFKRFKKEIEHQMAQVQANQPDMIITLDHWKYAHDMVAGAHTTEIVAEDREETVRKAREAEAALLPDNSRSSEPEEKDPTSLAEALPGDWKAEFKPKQRGVGGRSDEEELRKMGYKGGLAEFLKVRKELAATEDELGSSFGLDKDYDKTTGKWIN